MLVEYFRSHESIIQEEVKNEDLDEEEVVTFNEESDDESKMELKIDPIAQRLIDAYLYWSDREKKLKRQR